MGNHAIPSKNQCLDILKRYNTPREVIQHCIVVTGIVEEYCSKIPQIQKEVAIAGAMLHDIGRSINHSIFHAVDGVKILENENIDSRIVGIVRNHIGTGITLEEAEKLGLPSGEYIPQTLEEEIVSFSDNLAAGNDRRSFDETLNRFIDKFGEDSHVVKGFFRQKELIDSLLKSNKNKRE
jgi:uncharacterized protein (TIGR00295 family)